MKKLFLSIAIALALVPMLQAAPVKKSCQCFATGICICEDCGCTEFCQTPIPKVYDSVSAKPKAPAVYEATKLDAKYCKAMSSLKEGESVLVFVGCKGDGVCVDTLPGYSAGDVITVNKHKGVVYGSILPKADCSPPQAAPSQSLQSFAQPFHNYAPQPQQFAQPMFGGRMFGSGGCANGQCGR